MNPFPNAAWIWLHKDRSEDEYVEFEDTFYAKKGAEIRISCDGDYTLWVNGVYVSSGQYGDFEHYKIYDTVDLTPYLQPGKNCLRILVWHFGTPSQRYFPGKAGLIYEVFEEQNTIAFSGKRTLARNSPVYESGRKKKITGQLGYGFAYHAETEEITDGFVPAVPVEKSCVFFPLPIQKHRLAPLCEGKAIRRENNRILYDLGKECVGLLSLRFFANQIQTVRISFGERLDEDGWVPRIIGSRDFSVEYTAKPGENDYTNYMLRFGCRYLELESEGTLIDAMVGIRNQEYPIQPLPAEFENALDGDIYQICVNTLQKCMMEHYVDCPWREQNLYAFDSRNQMLCGYRVFPEGNRDYARANLLLFTQDRRSDGLLSICTPCGTDLTIPSFSLYYVIAVKEYVEHTNDVSIIPLTLPKVKEIIDTFLHNQTEGLICSFSGKNHWNFYDWSEYSEGTLGKGEPPEPDAVLNGIMILALDSLEYLCKKGGLPFPYTGTAHTLRKEAKRAFFHPETGLITMKRGTEQYTDLANSIGVLAEIVTGAEAIAVCKTIKAGKTVPCSLSMRTFKYDALLKSDPDSISYILKEIRRDYKVMLDAGSDCAWETVRGAEDFDGAGSLCHGWSAIPVLYLPNRK